MTRPSPVLTRTYLFTYGSRLVVIAIGFFVGVVSARGLGPAGRGLYAVAATTTVTIVQIANMGLSSAILYFVSRRRRRAGNALFLAWGGGAVVLVLTILTERLLSLAGLSGTVGRVISFWVPLQFVATFQDYVFLAVRDYARYNAFQIGGRILGLIAALAAVSLRPGDAIAFLVGQFLADLVTAIAVGLALLSTGILPRWSPRRWSRPVLSLALRAFPALVLPVLLIRSDILLMRVFRGNAETGVYSISAQLIDLLLVLPGTFTLVLFPSLAHSPDRGRQTLTVARSVSLLLCVLAVGIAAAGRFAIREIYGAPFAGAFWPMIVLLPGAIALGVGTIVGQYFASESFPRFLTLYWVAGFTINLVGNVFAIPRFGALAASVTSSVAYTLVAFLLLRKFFAATGLDYADLLSWSPKGVKRGLVL